MAKAKQNTDVAVVEDEKPAYLQALEKQGSQSSDDNFDASDIVIPRIKLLQGLSGECETFDNAKPGTYWHTGFDEPLGPEFQFVVCSRKKKYLLAAPLEDGQGILARAEDFQNWDRTGKWQVKIKGKKQPVTWEISDINVAKSGLDQWGTFDPDDEDSPPAATIFYDYLVILPDHLDWGPAVISLTRSQIKKAKKGLNTKIKLQGAAGRPMQALVFRAGTVSEQNSDGQDYRNWEFFSNGFASEALYNMANEYKDMLQQYRVADEEGAVSEESTGGAAPDTSDVPY